jgi:hypothetical protein
MYNTIIVGEGFYVRDAELVSLLAKVNVCHLYEIMNVDSETITFMLHVKKEYRPEESTPAFSILLESNDQTSIYISHVVEETKKLLSPTDFDFDEVEIHYIKKIIEKLTALSANNVKCGTIMINKFII